MRTNTGEQMRKEKESHRTEVDAHERKGGPARKKRRGFVLLGRLQPHFPLSISLQDCERREGYCTRRASDREIVNAEEQKRIERDKDERKRVGEGHRK